MTIAVDANTQDAIEAVRSRINRMSRLDNPELLDVYARAEAMAHANLSALAGDMIPADLTGDRSNAWGSVALFARITMRRYRLPITSGHYVHNYPACTQAPGCICRVCR